MERKPWIVDDDSWILKLGTVEEEHTDDLEAEGSGISGEMHTEADVERNDTVVDDTETALVPKYVKIVRVEPGNASEQLIRADNVVVPLPGETPVAIPRTMSVDRVIFEVPKEYSPKPFNRALSFSTGADLPAPYNIDEPISDYSTQSRMRRSSASFLHDRRNFYTPAVSIRRLSNEYNRTGIVRRIRDRLARALCFSGGSHPEPGLH